MSPHQVDRYSPGTMGFFQVVCAEGSHSLAAVSAVYGYPKGKRLANILQVDCLLQTNRGRLYQRIVKSVVDATREAAKDTQPQRERQFFQKIAVAGDGRCGWRALLAAADLSGYLAVPRTGHAQTISYKRHTRSYVHTCVYMLSMCTSLVVQRYVLNVYIYIYIYMRVRASGRTLGQNRSWLPIEPSAERDGDHGVSRTL